MTEPGEDAGPSGAVRLIVADQDAELVVDRLFQLGASAVTEAGRGAAGVELITDVAPEVLGAHGLHATPLAPVDVGDGQGPALARRCGERLVLRPLGAAPLAQEGLADQRRADAPPSAQTVEVLIDPGTAFGAGSHASTRCCLAALEPLAADATRVLDVGCGTGVLGLAALALGAGSVRAIDVDPAAVEATRRSALLNGAAERVVVDTSPLEQLEGRYDLVLANLLLPVVESLADELVRHVEPGGVLVIGGLLSTQVPRALVALQPLAERYRRTDGDWVAIAVAAPRRL
jgi:ribosomal protein L11 methyltransferase